MIKNCEQCRPSVWNCTIYVDLTSCNALNRSLLEITIVMKVRLVKYLTIIDVVNLAILKEMWLEMNMFVTQEKFAGSSRSSHHRYTTLPYSKQPSCAYTWYRGAMEPYSALCSAFQTNTKQFLEKATVNYFIAWPWLGNTK